MSFKNCLSHNLTKLMREHNLSGKELSNYTGVPTATIHKLRAGDIRNPTIDTLCPLGEYFGISLEQLIKTKINSSNDIIIPSHKNNYSIPLIEIDQLNKLPSPNIMRYIYSEYPANENTYCIQVKENGLKFEKDSLVFVDKKIEVKNNDYVLVRQKDSGVFSFKRIIFDDNEFCLASLTVGLEHKLFNYDEYTIEGVIVGRTEYFRDWE